MRVVEGEQDVLPTLFECNEFDQVRTVAVHAEDALREDHDDFVLGRDALEKMLEGRAVIVRKAQKPRAVALCGEKAVDHARVDEPVGEKEDVLPESRGQGRDEARVELPARGKEKALPSVEATEHLAKAFVRFAFPKKQGGGAARESEAREGTLKKRFAQRRVRTRAEIVVAGKRNHALRSGTDRT